MTSSEAKASGVDLLLNERQSSHGDYEEGAAISQALLAVAMSGSSYRKCSPAMKESIHMIIHKMHRIVTGNPDTKDHWDDIAGYARLISRILEKQESNKKAYVAADPAGAFAGAMRRKSEEMDKILAEQQAGC